jgi:hypothetical protein
MQRGGGGRRRRRLALLLVGGVVLALALAQVFLPRIAASTISSRLGRYGKVESVSVEAWPAVELLWGHADSATVKAESLALSTAQTAKLLWEARGVRDIDLTAASARVGRLHVSHVIFRKRGEQLTARAGMSASDVQASLPEGFDVQLLSSANGEIEVIAGGGLFGVHASVRATVASSDGRLVVSPQGLLLEGLRLTLFSQPHVHVQAVGAVATREAAGAVGYRLTISATLR